MRNNEIYSAFKIKFRIPELTIVDQGMWTWSLRPEQITLGSSVITLNRPETKLSNVEPVEMIEFAMLLKKIETSLYCAFGFDAINYLALMMVDKQVHYHVIPRYKDPQTFNELIWVDSGWPALPNFSDSQHSSISLNLIQDALKNQ